MSKMNTKKTQIPHRGDIHVQAKGPNSPLENKSPLFFFPVESIIPYDKYRAACPTNAMTLSGMI